MSASAIAKPSPGSLTALAGWGANLVGDCYFTETESVRELRGLLRQGFLPRGLGRSYGDPAINTNGLVVGMTKLDRYLAFDPESGRLTCEAGVSLERIIQDFVPQGWFPMITPGTKHVTVGGCIANDVHGKAHHSQGSFCACVDEMTLLLADGSLVVANRDQNSDLFWGTFGGMGLLGVVISATIRLRRIETTYFKQHAVRAKDLEALLTALDEFDQRFTYSVATVDALARGKRLGRGALTCGEHALLSELPPRLAKEPLRLGNYPLLTVPFVMPEATLNAVTARFVNAGIIYVQSRPVAFGHYEGFFYPLDVFHHWNRGYGRRGFTQYQFVVPFENALNHLRKILETIMASGQPPFLNILKRMGKQSDGHLSFPRPGYTFAIDFPIRRGTVDLLHKLDRMVLDAGGRIYLGKDSYLQSEMFRGMYPRLDEWLALKAKYDPDNRFTSDLGRRVGLIQG